MTKNGAQHADAGAEICRAAYCLFETAIGPCGIAWNERGLAALQLPETDRRATEARLKRKAPGAAPGEPPARMAAVVSDVQRYLTGEAVDFSPVGIDFAGIGEFERKVYDAARAIAWGHTSTYGELARLAGAPGAARQVGRAMATNPVPIIIPCHRVLAAGNRFGGFSAHGGALAKRRLLALEGGALPF